MEPGNTPRSAPASGESSNARGMRWLDGLLVFALSAAYLTLLPDCFNLFDEGMVADTAERIYRGEVLYRDIFAYWNPGGFWLCAAIYELAGISVASLRVSLALFGALAAVGVWLLARDHCGRPPAILAGLAGPLVLYPLWWMASPHWYSTFFAIAAAVALRRCIAVPGTSLAAFVTGMLCGVTFVVLQPVGVFCFAAIGICLAWDGAWIESWTRAISRVAVFALGGFVPVAAMYAYFAAHGALDAMVYDTFFWSLERYAPSAEYGGLFGLDSDLRYRSVRLGLMVLPPGVYVAAIGWVGWRYVRGTVTQRDRRLFALALVGTALLGSNFYYPDLIHLAFAAPPALAVLAALMSRINARYPPRFLAHGLSAFLLALLIMSGVSALQRERSRCSVELSTRRGTVSLAKPLALGLEGLVSFLDDRSSEGEPLYVYPVGPGYNFLTGHPNPAPYEMGWPQHGGNFTKDHLARMVAALEQKQVRYVVVLTLFGNVDPSPGDLPFERYIRDHYHVVESLPLLLIMERNER
jgi:hypothetical protein